MVGMSIMQIEGEEGVHEQNQREDILLSTSQWRCLPYIFLFFYILIIYSIRKRFLLDKGLGLEPPIAKVNPHFHFFQIE